MLSARVWRRSGNGAHQILRRSIGGVLLPGLEVLVAADPAQPSPAPRVFGQESGTGRAG